MAVNPVSPADVLRPLPESREAEMALLGALIQNNEAIKPVSKSGVDRSSFSVPTNGEILSAILRLNGAGSPVDLVTLRDELARSDRLSAVGGIEYLAALAEGVPGFSLEHAKTYADSVRDFSRRRGAVIAARRFAEAAAKGHANGELARLREALEDVETGYTPREASKPKTLEELRTLAVEFAETVKIPLGLPGIDEAIGGTLPGHFVTVGAFSGQGKTTVCVQQAVHKALLGHPTMVVTAELSEIEFAQKIEAGFENPFESLPTLKVWAPEGDIYAIVREVAEWAEGWKESKLCPVVVIDYLQKIQPPPGTENRERQVAIICEELQRLGRRHGIILIVAAQLNRKSQEDKPALHHLRESGLIEQVSDLAILVAKSGEASLWALVAKNRWGRSGFETELGVDFPCSRFGQIPAEVRYADLAEAVKAFLAGEKEKRSSVRDACRKVWWKDGRPTKKDLEAAAEACGGFTVSGSVVAIVETWGGGK